MTRWTISLLFTAVLASTIATLIYLKYPTVDNGQTINPILGDISFVETFGQQPRATTDEDLRIKTHLSYVEKLLRQKDVSNWTAEQKEKRSHLLDLLHAYWTAGVFPRNFDYPNKRVPCFIDKDGRICAVGYLIEQTAGRQTAEKINDAHKYDKLLAMNDCMVDSWIETSGLTKEECAMIQPTYESSEPIIAYGISYRIHDDFYQSFEIFTQLRRWKGDQLAKYNGMGIRFDYLKNKNFSAGIKFFKEVFRYTDFPIIPVWAITPICFQYNHTVGMNIKPELDLVCFGRKSPIIFHLSYGYDIPIIAENKFSAGRHDLSLKIALGLGGIDRLFKKKQIRAVG